MTTATDQLRALFDRQVEALHNGDLDTVMQNYRDDAVLIRFDAVARGIDEVRTMMAEYLSMKPRTLELVALQATDDVLFYEADMSIGGNAVKTYGTLVLQDGKIRRQTAIIAGPLTAGG
jgi:ketosteroid isomerase-like protein